MARTEEQSQPSDKASHIWKEGLIRLFISHRDKYKREARELAEELEGYGIWSFVAHDSIEPMKQWQTEIMHGLQTMEAMLAFVTDDFEKSVFCNQEIGFALGRGIPVVSVKLEAAEPPGFISGLQALRGTTSNPASDAAQVFKLVAEALGQGEKVTDGLLAAFVAAPSYIDAKARFERLDSVVTRLSDLQVRRLVAGFNENDQLHGSGYFSNSPFRITRFLKKVSGKSYEIRERLLVKRN